MTQREKIETVLRLKSLGLNVEQIAKGTCITEVEVEKIIRIILINLTYIIMKKYFEHIFITHINFIY